MKTQAKKSDVLGSCDLLKMNEFCFPLNNRVCPSDYIASRLRILSSS
jgi:hypothetical protein